MRIGALVTVIAALLAIAFLFARCEAQGVRNFDQIVLLDVQGLWGGRDLWVAADGKAWVRYVAPPKKADQPGLQEEIYKFSITEDGMKTLLGLIREHHFFAIQIKERPGVPDESRPMIYVRSGERERTVAKWGSDKNPDFDPILQFLLKSAAEGKKGELLFSRALDRSWKPEGFPDVEQIQQKQKPSL